MDSAKGFVMTRFLAANWLWIALIVAMFAMRRHGGCGLHDHHPSQSRVRDAEHAHHQSGARSTS
jgi:hypothetical protein